LQCAELADPAGRGGISQDCCSRHAGRDLLEQLQPFCAHAEFECRKSGNIAARPRQARNQAAADRVDGAGKYDRHGAARLPQRPNGRGVGGQQDVRRERDQFGGVLAIAVGIACAPASVDPHIAARGPAQILQRLQERADAGL
jgi:hypothetical protein